MGRAHGSRYLLDVLVNEAGLGNALAGWTLGVALGLSGDGRHIVGFGTNPDGNTEGWIAFLGTPTPQAGDYNGNGVVDAADYTVWRDFFGRTGSGLAADGDGNGTVNTMDYDFWKSRFGTCRQRFGGRCRRAGAGGASLAALALGALRRGIPNCSTPYWQRLINSEFASRRPRNGSTARHMTPITDYDT